MTLRPTLKSSSQNMSGRAAIKKGSSPSAAPHEKIAWSTGDVGLRVHWMRIRTRQCGTTLYDVSEECARETSARQQHLFKSQGLIYAAYTLRVTAVVPQRESRSETFSYLPVVRHTAPALEFCDKGLALVHRAEQSVSYSL